MLMSMLSKGVIKILMDFGMVVVGKKVMVWGYFNFNMYFGLYGFFMVMILGVIVSVVYIVLMKKYIIIKMLDFVLLVVVNVFIGVILVVVVFYVVGIINWIFSKFNIMVIEWIVKII